MELFPKNDRMILWYTIAAARILYVQMWRQSNIPTIENWILKVYSFLVMDNLMKYLRNLNISQNKVDWKKN